MNQFLICAALSRFLLLSDLHMKDLNFVTGFELFFFIILKVSYSLFSNLSIRQNVLLQKGSMFFPTSLSFLNENWAQWLFLQLAVQQRLVTRG